MDFQQAEQRFKKLKNQFKAGNLTETEFKTQLEKLMVQDEHKNWWMIGYETELWYRYDGENWVQGDFPKVVSVTSTSMPGWITLVWLTAGGAVGGAIGGTVSWAISGAISGLVLAITFRLERVLVRWLSILWILLAWAISGAGGWRIYWAVAEEKSDLIGLIVGGAIGWAVGGFLTAVTLRSENALSNWSNVAWVTLAWAIGGPIGWILSGAISGEFDPLIGWAIGWAVGWAIGGFITIWKIREEKQGA